MIPRQACPNDLQIALESRRMAMADMLTSARLSDLLDVRLDRLANGPANCSRKGF
jgi:hypothetical protein